MAASLAIGNQPSRVTPHASVSVVLVVTIGTPIRGRPNFRTGTSRGGKVPREGLPQQVDVGGQHHLVEAELEPACRLLTTHRVLDRGTPPA